MKKFLMISSKQRHEWLSQASLRTGIAPRLLEHDYWQSLVLQTIFQLPFASHLTLKGSRSLRPL